MLMYLLFFFPSNMYEQILTSLRNNMTTFSNIAFEHVVLLCGITYYCITRILHGLKKLKEFRRGHWEDASFEVSFKLAKWLGRRNRLKQKQKVDVCRTIRHDISLTGWVDVKIKIKEWKNWQVRKQKSLDPTFYTACVKIIPILETFKCHFEFTSRKEKNFWTNTSVILTYEQTDNREMIPKW